MELHTICVSSSDTPQQQQRAIHNGTTVSTTAGCEFGHCKWRIGLGLGGGGDGRRGCQILSPLPGLKALQSWAGADPVVAAGTQQMFPYLMDTSSCLSAHAGYSGGHFTAQAVQLGLGCRGTL